MLNALIAPHLVVEFSLSPAELGFITGAFFFGFGAMQLPLGVLLDRYGPKLMLFCLYSVAAIGGLIFIFAPGPLWLILGRFLMGVGVAGSMMGGPEGNAALGIPGPPALHLRQPFRHDRCRRHDRHRAHGPAGGGNRLAGRPRRNPLLCGSAAGADCPSRAQRAEPGPHQLAHLVAGAGAGSALALVWLIAPLSIASVGTNGAYLSLWTPIWLRDVAGFAQVEQEWALFSMMVATMAGMLLVGSLTQREARRGRSGIVIVLAGIAISLTAQVLTLLAATALAWAIWPLFAFGSASIVGLFAILARRFDPAMAGRVNTTLNFLMFAGSFAAQWGVGLIINQFPLADGGNYSPAAHQTALGIMLAIQLAGLVWYALRKAKMDPPPSQPQGTASP